MVVVSVHVIVVPSGNLLTDCSNALDMNALPKPPGCFNVLGVTDGNCGWAVLLGGLPDAWAVNPSRIGLPGLGSIGGGVVSGGGVVNVLGVGAGGFGSGAPVACAVKPSSTGLPGLGGGAGGGGGGGGGGC